MPSTDLVKKNIRLFIALISIFFIFQVSLIYYDKYLGYSLPVYKELLWHCLLIICVYCLLFYQIYRLRKSKQVISILIEILILAITVSIFTIIPVAYAKTIGIITEDIGYLYLFEVNLLFAVFLSATLYITRHISPGLSKLFFLLSINTVFIINCVAIAILYSTGFEIGPTVFLHFSWDAAKVGAGEYYTILLIISASLVPINMIFLRIMKNHKDRTINYTIASLAIITILTNSVILNFDTYKTKTILPIYSILDTAIRYSDSNLINIRKEYEPLHLDENEKLIIEELGIDLDAFTSSKTISRPSAPRNLITIYLESFQLNFTKYAEKEPYPGLTPNINSLSDDYVVYNNFINSVTPTINAMISSQCGSNIILSNEDMTTENNEVLNNDAVAKYLLRDNITCLSDILHQSGYYQVMMKAASMDFSGKGKFFLSHGYDLALDTNSFNINDKYTNLNLWGLQDPMLVDEALNMLDTLSNQQPFNLTFLTVNSHPPGYEYSDCPVYEPGNTMLNGIHCTDYALGLFLEKLKKMEIYKNTVVVIAGDHVLFKAITNSNLSSSWYGRTYLAIRTPDTSIKQYHETFGITPDIAPTILDLLGFKNMSFISGKSLISDRRDHQRITASGFDILDGKMIPENVDSLQNKCSISDSSNEKIHSTKQYNECQRAKIHYLQQKALYQ